jgi:hypothetical protein
MKGIVQVIANNAPAGGVGGFTGLLGDNAPAPQSAAAGDGEGTALAVLVAAGAVVVLAGAGTAALAWRRARREE